MTASLKSLGWNLALAPDCSKSWASCLPVLSLTAARVLKVKVDEESPSLQNLLCRHFRDGKGFLFRPRFPSPATGDAEQYKSRRKTVPALLGGMGGERDQEHRV